MKNVMLKQEQDAFQRSPSPSPGGTPYHADAAVPLASTLGQHRANPGPSRQLPKTKLQMEVLQAGLITKQREYQEALSKHERLSVAAMVLQAAADIVEEGRSIVATVKKSQQAAAAAGIDRQHVPGRPSHPGHDTTSEAARADTLRQQEPHGAAMLMQVEGLGHATSHGNRTSSSLVSAVGGGASVALGSQGNQEQQTTDQGPTQHAPTPRSPAPQLTQTAADSSAEAEASPLLVLPAQQWPVIACTQPQLFFTQLPLHVSEYAPLWVQKVGSLGLEAMLQIHQGFVQAASAMLLALDTASSGSPVAASVATILSTMTPRYLVLMRVKGLMDMDSAIGELQHNYLTGKVENIPENWYDKVVQRLPPNTAAAWAPACRATLRILHEYSARKASDMDTLRSTMNRVCGMCAASAVLIMCCIGQLHAWAAWAAASAILHGVHGLH
mmetsp:Transcript_20176/g.43964  ORF Transcript_20176/g.43964 Transcript_20176/m.43964 type:complete len:442 (-) Transcript_20176:71-1396(-)|eukprot:CAMPEP_0202904944 /NCGR_PEP_ID=MMETSP1392-20130828/31881_1 /ASSEMBLY_ACC=CAM_ASM_000868 /TAXON_ID=225041 /ORGANISM="Chlamydomonas chlamydogama, Strain SAG 11-48b" /LENGTH=441 /DNA_ID=CAMNT_0049592831 /DNA_START=100 /DNA_END=1425 /DNA_ORIENTATION=-